MRSVAISSSVDEDLNRAASDLFSQIQRPKENAKITKNTSNDVEVMENLHPVRMKINSAFDSEREGSESEASL